MFEKKDILLLWRIVEVKGDDGMAISKCVKCENSFFELKEVNVQGARFKLNFIQCTSCGGVVGVVPYYDPGVEAHQVNAKIDEIKTAISRIEDDIDYIQSRIR